VGIQNVNPDTDFEVGKSTDSSRVARVSGQFAEFQARIANQGGFMVTQSAGQTAMRWGWVWTNSNDSWKLTSKNNNDLLRIQSDKMSINYGTPIYELTINGRIGATESTIYNISDRRHKKNVASLNNGTQILEKLEPVTFQYKKDHPIKKGDKIYRPALMFTEHHDVGFIAQDAHAALKKKFPKIANRLVEQVDIPAVEDEEGNELAAKSDRYMMDTSRLIPVLVAAFKEQNARINALEARIAALETNE
jgi:hypothetical protein